ncbi:unnamed protein product [Miscanthus lutarioriparius]|uniref:Uncharacterized protein n=1 Tax=Miscanthus lutarioriparius TaxID=422564 RepID=A0A811NUU8_9POAL|nr:unnamed protein product [Miscanthus lutarioriparius]
MDPGKLQTDVGSSDDDDSDEDYVDSEEGETSDDEDFSDEDASESSNEDDDEDSSKSAKDKNRPAEKALKTPPEKKAKMTTPSKGSGTGMRSGYVHVATPYPSKLVKKTPSIVEKPNNLLDMPATRAADDKSKDSPLNQRLAWRKQRILINIKLMLVALKMMKVMNTVDSEEGELGDA